jgi:hypothetical protein
MKPVQRVGLLLASGALLLGVACGQPSPKTVTVEHSSSQVTTSSAPDALTGAIPSSTATTGQATPTTAKLTTTTTARQTTTTTLRPTTTTTYLSNDNYYTNVDGNTVHSPAQTPDGSVPPGATAQCRDGSYSFSQHRSGTCSSHGGVSSWL